MPRADKLIFTTLFFSIFATITGVGIVVPLLPVYAHDLGAGGLMIAMIFGAFFVSRTLLLPFFGRLSDRKGRKPIIVPGLLAYTLVSAAFLLATNVSALITIRLFQGIASAMLLPVIQAYVGDLTPPGREGFTMGLFNMSVFFGLSLGPVLGGLINDRLGLEAAFLGMGGLSFAGFLLSLCLLPPAATERVVQRSRPPARWQQLLRKREVKGMFLFRFAYTACIGMIWGFLPLLASERLALSGTSIGFLVMLGIAISGLIHLPMGYAADRLNKTLMVACGGTVVSLAVLSYAWTDRFSGMVLASVAFGIGGGISMPALMAASVIVGEKSESMGSVMALLTLAHSLGMLVGSMSAGLMMDLIGLQAAFPVGAALMAAGTVAFTFYRRGIPARKQRQSGRGVMDNPIGIIDESVGLVSAPPENRGAAHGKPGNRLD